jgi:hypothetical protein
MVWHPIAGHIVVLYRERWGFGAPRRRPGPGGGEMDRRGSEFIERLSGEVTAVVYQQARDARGWIAFTYSRTNVLLV